MFTASGLHVLGSLQYWENCVSHTTANLYQKQENKIFVNVSLALMKFKNYFLVFLIHVCTQPF